MSTFGLKKKEILKREKDIKALFSLHSFTEKSFPFVIRYRMIASPSSNSSSEPSLVGFTVPKKKIRKAVDRIRIKRQMREIFRLNKEILIKAISPEQQVHLMIIYISPKRENYSLMESKLIKLLNRIQNIIEK